MGKHDQQGIDYKVEHKLAKLHFFKKILIENIHGDLELKEEKRKWAKKNKNKWNGNEEDGLTHWVGWEWMIIISYLYHPMFPTFHNKHVKHKLPPY